MLRGTYNLQLSGLEAIRYTRLQVVARLLMAYEKGLNDVVVATAKFTIEQHGEVSWTRQSVKALIDHIVTNYPQSISQTGIISSAIVSDHDAIFACVNVQIPRFEPRYKFIRREKNLDED